MFQYGCFNFLPILHSPSHPPSVPPLHTADDYFLLPFLPLLERREGQQPLAQSPWKLVVAMRNSAGPWVTNGVFWERCFTSWWKRQAQEETFLIPPFSPGPCPENRRDTRSRRSHLTTMSIKDKKLRLVSDTLNHPKEPEFWCYHWAVMLKRAATGPLASHYVRTNLFLLKLLLVGFFCYWQLNVFLNYIPYHHKSSYTS